MITKNGLSDNQNKAIKDIRKIINRNFSSYIVVCRDEKKSPNTTRFTWKGDIFETEELFNEAGRSGQKVRLLSDEAKRERLAKKEPMKPKQKKKGTK